MLTNFLITIHCVQITLNTGFYLAWFPNFLLTMHCVQITLDTRFYFSAMQMELHPELGHDAVSNNLVVKWKKCIQKALTALEMLFMLYLLLPQCQLTQSHFLAIFCYVFYFNSVDIIWSKNLVEVSQMIPISLVLNHQPLWTILGHPFGHPLVIQSPYLISFVITFEWFQS